VCSDSEGKLEGALVLILERKFKTVVNPWRRTYKEDKLAPWELMDGAKFCENVVSELNKGPFQQKKSKVMKHILKIIMESFQTSF
jgi:hypothetical protein